MTAAPTGTDRCGGDACVSVSSGVLPLLSWEKFVMPKGVISVHQKLCGGEGACLKPGFFFLTLLVVLAKSFD